MARNVRFSKEEILEKRVGFNEVTSSNVDKDDYSHIKTRKIK